MKAYINDAYKVAYVLTDDVGMACRIGLWFGRDNPDLAKWVICCLPTERMLSRGDRREADVDGARSLADAIREGSLCTHSCPRHPPQQPGLMREQYEATG